MTPNSADSALAQPTTAPTMVDLGALYLATGSLAVVAIAAAVIVTVVVCGTFRRGQR